MAPERGKVKEMGAYAEEGRSLTVRSSQIKVGGAVRVHTSVLQDLGLESRGVVVVQAGKKQVALHLFGDRHVTPGHAVLRRPDMRRLGVKDGESVSLRGHVRVRQILSRRFRRAETEEKPKPLRSRRHRSGGR